MMLPRIVTLTVNPAVDMAAEAGVVRPTHKIRTFGDRYDPGGGGINVARVLHELGAETLALITAGGVTGDFVGALLTQAGVPWSAVPIRAPTRIDLSIFERTSGLEYRFVPQGPHVEEAEWRTILARLETIDTDWLVASGSLPPGVPTDFYADVGEIMTARGIRFALDTSGEPLLAAIRHGIDLLKPSLTEFETLLGREIRDLRAQERYALDLVRSGAASRLAVTLGADGAILATRSGTLRRAAPAIEQRSTVGAGDSFMAGLVLGLARGWGDGDALDLALAAGAVAAAGTGTAQVRCADVEVMYGQLAGGGSEGHS
jgi:6-phosphofructokinase 2